MSTTTTFALKRACLVTMTILLVLQVMIYSPIPAKANPTVKDPSLKVELITKGIKFPTSMAFLGPNDILILEKNQGTVKRIVNGNILPEPLLDVNVANKAERGMLGIAISHHVANKAVTNQSHMFSLLH